MITRSVKRFALAAAVVALAVAMATPAFAAMQVSLVPVAPAGGTVSSAIAPTNNTLAFALASGQFSSTGNAFGEIFFASPSQMDMSTVSVSSAGAGTVRIIFSMNGITSPTGAGSITQAITAQFVTGSGSFSLQTYGSNANTLFTSVPAVPPATVTPAATVSGQETAVDFTATNPYSLTQVLTINFVGAGTVALSSDSKSSFFVPEPSTLVMFGLGAVGMGFGAVRRRFRKTT